MILQREREIERERERERERDGSVKDQLYVFYSYFSY